MADPVQGNQFRSTHSLLDRFMLEEDEPGDCAANQVDDALSPPAEISVLNDPVSEN